MKNRVKLRVSEITSGKDKSVKILINSCLSRVDRIVMKGGKTESG